MGSIKKNFVYNSVYQVVAIIVPLITTPYVSRVMGAPSIGLVSYYHTIANYFVMFAMLGINNYGNRSIARVRDNILITSKTFSEIFTLQVLLSLLSTVVYAFCICLIFENKIIALLEGLYVVSAFLEISWLFFGLEDFKVTALRSSLIKILSTIAIFVFVKDASDVALYAAICCGMYIISNCVLWPRLKKYGIKFRIQPIRGVFSHFKGVCVLFLPLLGVSLYKYMDKLMLGMMVSKVEVGWYESAEKIINVPVSFVAALGTVMLPRISNMMANDNKDACERYMKYSMVFAVFLSSSMAFGISAVVDEFVPIFYGSGFDQCKILIPILMFATVFLAIGNVTRTQFLIPGNYDKIFIGSIFTGAIVNLVLNGALIPYMASTGAAIATVIAEVTVCLFQIVFISKFMPIWTFLIQCTPYIIIGGVMFLCLRFLNIPVQSAVARMMIKIGFGILIYGVLLILYLVFFKRNEVKKVLRKQ